MKIAVLGLILTSVTMSAVAQIALKYGMSSPLVQAHLNSGLERVAPLIASSPFVWAGLSLYGAGALLWLGVLAQIDVSQAYPYVGLGFLLTMVFGVFLLGESVSAMRLLGTLLVIAGVVLVSRS
jgi:drug/metabolite transporter (DMT)-like permease